MRTDFSGDDFVSFGGAERGVRSTALTVDGFSGVTGSFLSADTVEDLSLVLGVTFSATLAVATEGVAAKDFSLVL